MFPCGYLSSINFLPLEHQPVLGSELRVQIAGPGLALQPALLWSQAVHECLVVQEGDPGCPASGLRPALITSRSLDILFVPWSACCSEPQQLLSPWELWEPP